MLNYYNLDARQEINLPSTVYSGSLIKFVGDCPGSLQVMFGDRVIQLPSFDYQKPIEVPVIGNSGWHGRVKIINLTDEHCGFKLYIMSTPRSRSKEWSWKEEKLGSTTQKPTSKIDDFLRVLALYNTHPKKEQKYKSGYMNIIYYPNCDTVTIDEGKFVSNIKFYSQKGGEQETTIFINTEAEFIGFLKSRKYKVSKIKDISLIGWTRAIYVAKQHKVEFYFLCEHETTPNFKMSYYKITIMNRA
ncbi:hypothetical protein [Runella sp.]|uniref:hypothetical protein n=1 Tax=Runella sp. TaxID=1960881 RepID=UPI003D0D132F